MTLGVSDLGLAAAFYDRLGWRRSTESNDWIIWFVTSGCVLGLTPIDALAADTGVDPSSGKGFGGVTLAINVASGDEVAPTLQAAETAGGTILKPATQAGWGGVTGYFADVDGYPWEVVWSPAFPLDDRGQLRMP